MTFNLSISVRNFRIQHWHHAVKYIAENKIFYTFPSSFLFWVQFWVQILSTSLHFQVSTECWNFCLLAINNGRFNRAHDHRSFVVRSGMWYGPVNPMSGPVIFDQYYTKYFETIIFWCFINGPMLNEMLTIQFFANKKIIWYLTIKNRFK